MWLFQVPDEKDMKVNVVVGGGEVRNIAALGVRDC